MLYRRMVRPVLYRVGRGDPEVAHERTLGWLGSISGKPWLLDALSRLNVVRDPCRVFGIDFPNAVGLAAGMDKNGVALHAWPALGFGFMEIGTVTWRAQPGNPRPRLYRLPDSNALINRMGFNNDGAQALARRLASGPRPKVPVGISLGKSKATPLDRAVDDYVASFVELYRFADYFAVNVSSPNTPGLRNLQDADELATILRALYEEGVHLAGGGRPKPILVKIAPDLTETAIGQALEVCLSHGVSGVIAANTTLGRDGVAASDLERAAQPGGLSGGPLREITRSIVSFVYRETSGRLPVIGVGGITAPDHAAALIDAGASLVQLYTGLVYSGPRLVKGAARAARRSSHQTRSPRPRPQGGGHHG
ncbi:dihydroorotate oxidase A [Stackebrandtia albiflava]|uniref:Dihydroorotate dehydrogenase (quinone) n=1 Tax=Stackebrandtia albiflava TaxID=406432 RepID=A0A562VCX6_9ACTN|nr:quinone-dependent dihydroorotate dehydrogenase [Stackebrandtia albiflava]TWJ15753.1 dihydroorotate oxidase A [Stackebrandtia albiflava]